MSTSPPVPSPADSLPSCSREHPRTAMFVAATIIARGLSNPVRVRNMSRHGALLEGAILPRPGEEVTLQRAHLKATGRVSWAAGNRFGLAFDDAVDVDEWMARLAQTHQQRVDAMVQQAREDMAAGIPLSATMTKADRQSLDTELGSVIHLIEELEDALSDDAEVIARHAAQMQSIDRALQMLRGIAKRL